MNWSIYRILFVVGVVVLFVALFIAAASTGFFGTMFDPFIGPTGSATPVTTAGATPTVRR